MITGKFINRELIVGLELIGPEPQTQRIEAVVDTGFNGYLTLPRSLIVNLRLPFAGHRRGELADGSVVLLHVFLGTIVWHGKPREVLISQTAGGPLVGRSLLEQNRVGFDATEGGILTIDELPQSPG